MVKLRQGALTTQSRFTNARFKTLNTEWTRAVDLDPTAAPVTRQGCRSLSVKGRRTEVYQWDSWLPARRSLRDVRMRNARLLAPRRLPTDLCARCAEYATHHAICHCLPSLSHFRIRLAPLPHHLLPSPRFFVE